MSNANKKKPVSFKKRNGKHVSFKAGKTRSRPIKQKSTLSIWSFLIVMSLILLVGIYLYLYLGM